MKQLKKILCTISPKLTTKLMFYYNFHKVLDMKNPQDINEKLQVLKLNHYYNNDTITQCADKYRVREYMKSKCMEHMLPTLYASYDKADNLRNDWDSFPNKIVVKCNHGSGYNIIISDKSKENLDDIILKLNKWMAEDYWKVYCEPQYKFIKKKIIVEQHLGDNINTYKFYCFNGKPHVLYISENGENGEKDLYYDYYDMEWKWQDITLDRHLHKKELHSKPKNLEEMVAIVRQLSKDFPFVRIDLYNIDGEIYLSEFTFIPTGGNMKLKPERIIKEWGDMLKLPIDRKQ